MHFGYYILKENSRINWVVEIPFLVGKEKENAHVLKMVSWTLESVVIWIEQVD